MRRRRRCGGRLCAAVAALAVAALAACGATPAPLRADPHRYLLGIDDLVAPDFVADAAPSGGEVAAAAATGDAVASLHDAGFLDAATQDYFRGSPPLALLNGPAEITDTAVELGSAAGAAAVFSSARTHFDGLRGARAMSTGSLGDAAHAVSLFATAPGGIAAVEFVVVWRLANVVDVLVVRGRNGGVRLDDALLLAHRQTVIELATVHVTPSPT